MNDGQPVGTVPRVPIPENVVLNDDGRVAAPPAAPSVVASGRPADVTISPVEVDVSRMPPVEPPGHPGPTGPRPVIDPAPVMVGKPTPGLIADPGPPAGEVPPPTVAKRRPSHRNGGHPDVSVGAVVIPVAMMVQRMDSRVVDTPQVAGGTTAHQKGVAAPAPELEIVQIPNQRLDSALLCVQKQLLSGFHLHLPARAGDFRPALVDHQAHGTAGIDLDSVESFLSKAHRGQIRLRMDPTTLVHTEDQITLVNLQDVLFLGQLREEDVGLSGDSDEVAVPQLHLDPGIGVGDDPVAADQGKIEGHLAPVHVTRRLVGGAAVHEADPGRMFPAGRNPRGGKSRHQDKERGQRSQSLPPPRFRVSGTACWDWFCCVHDGLTSYRRSASLLGSIDRCSILAASIIVPCRKRKRATTGVARFLLSCCRHASPRVPDQS